MLKNYLLVAIRNFWRNKIFSFINIMGLSIGISAALVIFLIVHYDLSFDKFHKDSYRIYRIVTEGRYEGSLGHMRGTPMPLADVVAKELTGVEITAPFYELSGQRVSIPAPGKEPILFRHQSGVIFASQQYFSLLDYQWLAGSSHTALQNPFQVVLTEERAKTYFPSLNPTAMIGRTITYFDSIPVVVTGVVKEPEGNTDFVFREFISFPTISTSALKDGYPETWDGFSSAMQLFIKLSKEEKPGPVAARLKRIQEKYDPDAEANSKNGKNFRTFLLQPLSDLHLDGEYGSFDSSRQAHKPTLVGLSILAIILLLLACINFVNLTTARASQRAREIGIRKTIGSSRAQLIAQFFSETFLTTVMATFVSLLLVPLLLKVFADFIPQDLHFNWFQQPALIGFLVLLLLFVSVLSGFYPAIVLSGYRPVQVLKASSGVLGGQTTRRSVMRKTLTIAQFVIAQAFIIATLIVGRQIRFMLTRDLGFRKQAILYFKVPNTDTGKTRRLALLDELRSFPGIEAVSLGGNPPASESFWGSGLTYRGGNKDITTTVELKFGDSNFLSLYRIPLLAGHNVTPSDTIREYIINEAYARFLGFRDPREAINKFLYSTWNKSIRKPIVGVIRDFHAHSLHQEIRPLIFTANGSRSYTFHVALASIDGEGNSWSPAIHEIEQGYKKFYPDEEFQYHFYDESIAAFYKSEQDVSSLLRWATGIAIFISCLGMLGLVVYTTTLRTKEIGVRKVLGASVSQIVTLLSKDFMALVGIAFVIATPIAWWSMHQWLKNFAFQPAFGWWLVLLAGAGMAIIALLILCLQTVRAARANPVDSLRTE